MKSVQGKIALVTGGANGIGLAVANKLGYEGAKVLLNDYDKVALNSSVRNLVAQGIDAEGFLADVSQAVQVERMFTSIKASNKRIDILVNNAGIIIAAPFPPILTLTEKDWDRVINVNLKGAFLCSREAFALMVKEGSGGSIVNMSSISGQIGSFTGQVHYSASKAGLIGLTKSLAVCGAPFGIRANAVTPGFIDTGMGPSSNAVKKSNRTLLRAHTLMRRYGSDTEVADAVRFLASEESSYITGSTIEVNGGAMMTLGDTSQVQRVSLSHRRNSKGQDKKIE